MDKKEIVNKLKSLNDMIEDFLDNMDMDEADEKAEQKEAEK